MVVIWSNVVHMVQRVSSIAILFACFYFMIYKTKTGVKTVVII